MYKQRIAKELKLLQHSPGPGVSCWASEGVSERVSELRAQVTGPEDTPYEGGVFLLSLSIPERYPFEPPHVRFITPVYHPNIDSDGRICLDTLKMQPQGSWAPAVNINTLLLTIRVLLAYPNPADGLVADITDQYKRDLNAFKADARRWTLLHACTSTGDTLNNIIEGSQTRKDEAVVGERSHTDNSNNGGHVTAASTKDDNGSVEDGVIISGTEKNRLNREDKDAVSDDADNAISRSSDSDSDSESDSDSDSDSDSCSDVDETTSIKKNKLPISESVIAVKRRRL